MRNLALIIGLSIAACVFAATDPKASRFYEDALIRYEKKDHAGAIVQLKNALQIDNRNLAAQVLLGRALLSQGDIVAAEVAFIEALRLGVDRSEVAIPLARALINQGKQGALLTDPRLEPAGLQRSAQFQLMVLRAGALADLNKPQDALKLLAEARLLDPSSAATWNAEVPIRIRLGQLDEARGASERALITEPSLAQANYLRGSVAHAGGDVTTAVIWYAKALQSDPEHVEALVSRAGANLDRGLLEDVDRDVRHLLKAQPSEPRGLYIKALLAERRNDRETSRAAFNQVTVVLDPVPFEFLRYRPQLLMLGGLAHYGLGQTEKAKPYLEAIQRLQPNSPALKLLAQIHVRDKNVDRATETLSAYLRANPNDRQALLLLASAHMSQGRYARATQLMQDALARNEAPQLRTALGASLVGSGRLADAVVELEAALAKDREQIGAGTALAMIYLNEGSYAKAERLAADFARRQPRNAGLQNLLGATRAARGDLKAARSAFELALQIDGKFTAAHLSLARIDIAAGNLEAAASRLDSVLAREQQNTDALLLAAEIAERRMRFADAQRYLEKAGAVAAGPDQLKPGIALVNFHLRQGRGEGAREALQQVKSKAPEALDVLMASARVYLSLADLPGARSALARASTLAAMDADALVRTALLQVQAGAIPAAIYSLEKALDRQPDMVPALAMMSDLELRRGDVSKAETLARQVLAAQPRAALGHALLGDVAAFRGQPSAAVDHYRRAHDLERSSMSALRLYRSMAATNPPAAERFAADWLKSTPEDLLVRRALADSRARQGDFAAARPLYETIVRLAPTDAEALNNLANVLIELKEPGALAFAKRALALKPNASHIMGTAGWAAVTAGQTDHGIQLLRDARLRDPGNPDTRYFLAAALASQGRTAEARAEAEAALKADRPAQYARQTEALLQTLK